MSAARFLAALAGLGCGLIFYAVYRCDQTLSNRALCLLCGERYAQMKEAWRHWLALPPVLRGCLPSALWCFVGGCLCGGWRLRLGSKRELALAWLFPALNALWEGVQALGGTDGRADATDVLAGMVGGALSLALFRSPGPQERTAAPVCSWGWRLAVLVACVSTMGLADVWR